MDIIPEPSQAHPGGLYADIVEKRKAELIAAPWEGYIDDLSVTGLSRRLVDTREIYVKISITDSAQVLAAQEFTTTPQKRTGKNEWSLSRESSMKIVPTSTFMVSVFEIDSSKSPPETLKYKSGQERIALLDFAHRGRSSYNTGYSAGPLHMLEETEQSCSFAISFTMQTDNGFNKKVAQLEVKDLRSGLVERPLS